MKTLGEGAITNKKNKDRFKRFKSTIKNALRGNKKEERSSSVSSDSPSPQKNRPLLDFMKRQVGRITSAVVSNRSRSNESDRGL